MELFLDTADLKEIKELNEIVTLTGVTTNPKIVSTSKKDIKELVKEIDKILSKEQLLFVQVIKTDYKGIVEEAKQIAKLRKKNIYVKIPATEDGLKAIKECKKLGIPTLATALFSKGQAFLAGMNGAAYLAPYVNRMEDYCDGIQETIDLVEMVNINKLDTKVIAASFKNVNQVQRLMAKGIHAVTVSPDILRSMINHPGTKAAVEDFSNRWEDAFKRKKLLK